ncbi:hypothetical protein ACFE04_028383 [Oxalis oulophora]
MKLKRKEIDDINEDFSDFSLSSPALKIRRLDVDLPPIMEQVVEVEEDALNQERAIVLFNPSPTNQINTNNFTLSVHPHHLIISPYNTTTNRLFTPSDFPNIKWEDDNDDHQSDQHQENKCLAVVPWVAPLLPPTNQPIIHLSQSEQDAPQFMEADECGPAAMDVEDGGYALVDPYDSNGLPWQQQQQQQQQQHCLIPQMPTTTSTPVTWFQHRTLRSVFWNSQALDTQECILEIARHRALAIGVYFGNRQSNGKGAHLSAAFTLCPNAGLDRRSLTVYFYFFKAFPPLCQSEEFTLRFA